VKKSNNGRWKSFVYSCRVVIGRGIEMSAFMFLWDVAHLDSSSFFNNNIKNAVVVEYRCSYPSKKRDGIYQAIREEWRAHRQVTETALLDQHISVAYKGLEQLRQYDVQTMTGGRGVDSPNWSVSLEKNPMPKPADYDERKTKRSSS